VATRRLATVVLTGFAALGAGSAFAVAGHLGVRVLSLSLRRRQMGPLSQIQSRNRCRYRVRHQAVGGTRA
jgi:hypothetical protein